MKVLLKIIKGSGWSLLILVAGYLLFMIFLVIPNDRRVQAVPPVKKYSLSKRSIVYDLIKLSPAAVITHGNYAIQYRELGRYAGLINDNRDFHLRPENMHVSLGWYPLKVVHRNCLYAPTPTDMTYELTLPKHAPALSFSCGVLDNPAEFKIIVIPEGGGGKLVFEKNIAPLAAYAYRYTDPLYRNLWQYLNVQMEDHDNKWYDFQVGLESYAGQKVKIQLETAGQGGQAFWANPLITADRSKDEKKYNLILVVMDSTRRDAIGRQGDGRSFTPNLDLLAAQGVSFDQHLANGNMTKQSVTSFLTSRLPYELGDVSLEYVASVESRKQFYHNNFATLAGELNKDGYRTAAIGVISLITDGAGFGVDFGFDDARVMERYGYSNVYITDEAINWLGSFGGQPFALLVYYDSAHGPYKPPFQYLWQTKKELGEFNSHGWYKALYEAEVAYNDHYLGKLFAALDNLGLSSNTLVAVTSDHAENLDWHTLPNSSQQVIFHDHGISVRDVDVKVPLIMRLPDKITRPRSVTQTTQHLDLAPTILDLMGLPPGAGFTGHSLAALCFGKKLAAPQTIFIRGRFNKGIRVGDQYKYIRNFGVYEKRGKNLQDFIPEELYDLRQDPLEQNNIIDRDFQVRQDLRLLLDNYEPDPEVNIFTFKNMGGQSLSGSITAAGLIADEELAGGGQAEVEGNSLKITAYGDKTVLKFTTRPYNASLKIDLNYAGQPLPVSKFLVSGYALPLLEDKNDTVSGADYYWLKGVPEYEGKSGSFATYWSRMALYKLEWEKQAGVSGLFKEMLSEWGYLSEAQKK